MWLLQQITHCLILLRIPKMFNQLLRIHHYLSNVGDPSRKSLGPIGRTRVICRPDYHRCYSSAVGPRGVPLLGHAPDAQVCFFSFLCYSSVLPLLLVRDVVVLLLSSILHLLLFFFHSSLLLYLL